MILAGLDIGQVIDYMALVLVQVVEDRPPRYVVRFVYRWPLALPNAVMIGEIKRILHACLPETVYLNVDYSGKGAVFTEFLERAFQAPPRLTNVMTDYSVFTAPMKQNLASNTKLLLGDGRLKFARGTETHGDMLQELFDELCNYQVRIRESPIKGTPGTELGALGYGQHDDLATALMLALEDAEYSPATSEMYWIRH